MIAFDEIPHDGDHIIDSTCMDMKTLEEPSQVPTLDPCIPPTIPIPISDLGTHIADCHLNGNVTFQTQYQVKYFCNISLRNQV